MEGHLVCNGVFRCFLSLFHATTLEHIRFIEADLGKTWRIIPCPMAQGRQTDGWEGKNRERLKREYGACETGPNEGRSGELQAVSGERSGSDLCSWWVRLTVTNPAQWSVRTVVLVFDCVMIVSQCEAARRRTQSPQQLRWIWAVMGFVRVWRPTLEAELIGGSSQDNQLEKVRGLGRGGQTHPGWDRDGDERKNMKYNGRQ